MHRKRALGSTARHFPPVFTEKTTVCLRTCAIMKESQPQVMQFGAAWPDANIETIDKSTEIAPGMNLLALISDAPGTKELKELSLTLNTPQGMIIIVGCSHPGIDKIVEAATAINPKIHLVLGGFHMVTATDEGIAKKILSLKYL